DLNVRPEERELAVSRPAGLPVQVGIYLVDLVGLVLIVAELLRRVIEQVQPDAGVFRIARVWIVFVIGVSRIGHLNLLCLRPAFTGGGMMYPGGASIALLTAASGMACHDRDR